jgi:hypothetical protein
MSNCNAHLLKFRQVAEFDGTRTFEVTRRGFEAGRHAAMRVGSCAPDPAIPSLSIPEERLRASTAHERAASSRPERSTGAIELFLPR